MPLSSTGVQLSRASKMSQEIRALQGPQQKQGSYSHDLALLLKHLERHQLLHVVLACAVIQNLLGAINETP